MATVSPFAQGDIVRLSHSPAVIFRVYSSNWEAGNLAWGVLGFEADGAAHNELSVNLEFADDVSAAQFAQAEGEHRAHLAAEAESERRAEAGPDEVSGGWTDPREDAAGRAYEDLMSHLPAPTWETAAAALARNDAALLAQSPALGELTPRELAAVYRALVFRAAPSQMEGDEVYTALGKITARLGAASNVAIAEFSTLEAASYEQA